MEIPCKWRPIDEYGLTPESADKKEGRYHGSMFWDVKGFGSKRWVVAGYLEADINSYLKEGIPEKQLVEACLQYLNQPPPRRKFQKKQAKPLYGHLEYYRHKIKEDGIEVLVITDQKKNARFWSEGAVLTYETRKVK